MIKLTLQKLENLKLNFKMLKPELEERDKIAISDLHDVYEFTLSDLDSAEIK